MATASTRKVSIGFSGQYGASNVYQAAVNADSPGQHEYKTLALGNNTITPPGGGSTPVAVTIVPPAGNTGTITLKGINADTGVVLHKTDPSSFGLNSSTATFVLTASVQITDVQLIWS